MKRTSTTVSIVIDPVACDAYGYCAELLPEHVSLDEWGYPLLDGVPLSGEQAARAQEAARQCPRRAFLLLAAGAH